MMPGEAMSAPTVYCIVPRELAPKLHEPLRRHFRGDPSVQVVVELRQNERRGRDRRTDAGPGDAADERRRIRADEGRRVADRRARTELVSVPALPRGLRRHVGALTFVERLEPSSQMLADIDSARLALAAQAGDRDAFKGLYLRYFDPVYGYVRVMLNDHQEAEDVTQDIFLKAFEALPRYTARRGTPFRAWLFHIARNTSINRIKRLGRLQLEEPELIGRRVEAEADDRPPFTLDWASDSDLMFLIERLPQPQRQALALRYIVGLTTTEIADVMGRTPEAVAQLQYRAKRFLEERLTAIQRRDTRATRRAPMLIRLRRMPVLGARRAPVPGRTVAQTTYASTAVRRPAR